MKNRSFLCVASVLLLVSCAVPTDRAPEVTADLSPVSLYAPHGEPGAWFNPWLPRTKRLTTLIRWMMSRSAYTGEWRNPLDVPQVANTGASFAEPEHSASVTWVGHST